MTGRAVDLVPGPARSLARWPTTASPLIDVGPLLRRPAARRGPDAAPVDPALAEVAAAIDAACRQLRLLPGHRSRRRTRCTDPPGPARPRVLRAARRRQGAHRHAPRRGGVAGLVPARGRADLGPTRPEGGPLLRHRAARRPSRGAVRASAARTEPLPERTGRPRSRRGDLDGRHDRSRPAAAHRDGARPGARRAVVRAHGDRRPDGAVPRLPLPAHADRGVGRGRAHRLRAADLAGPGRQRRTRGATDPTGGSRYRATPTCSSSTSATCSRG